MAIKGRTDADPVDVMYLFEQEAIYLMPYFQRQYAWNAKGQVKQLWEDLVEVTKQGESDLSFLGALVLQEKNSATPSRPAEYVVIDGQQRLTTIYLALLALTIYAEEKNWGEIAEDNYDYLLSKKSGAKNQPKIKPTDRDYAQINPLLKKLEGVRGERKAELFPQSGSRGGHLLDAYTEISRQIEKYLRPFENDVQEAHAFYREIFEALLRNMQMIQITLGDEQRPNEVFERLNARQEKLRVLDLVRNHVFLRIPEPAKKSKEFRDHVWASFEEDLRSGTQGGEGVSSAKERDALIERMERQENDFFFPYALINRPKAKKNQLYTELSRYWGESRFRVQVGSEDQGYGGSEKIIADMRQYIPYYLALHARQRPPHLKESLWGKISRIPSILPGATHPFLMQVLKATAEGRARSEETFKVFRALEALFVRRYFCGLGATGTHPTFRDLWSSSKQGRMPLMLERITRGVKFPDDEDLARSIVKESLPVKIRRYVLLEYEMHLQKKTQDPWDPPADCEVDHVMPRARLKRPSNSPFTRGEFEDILDSWGNLTLLGKGHNRAKKDLSITRANEVLKLEENTKFEAVKDILRRHDQKADWDVTAIQKRSKHLAEWAVRRWPKKV